MSEKRCKKHAAVFDHRIVVELVDDSECPVCNPQNYVKGIDTDLVRNCADEYPDKTQKIEDLCYEIDRLTKDLEFYHSAHEQEQRAHAAMKNEIDRLRNIINGIGLEYPIPKINTTPFRDAARNYTMTDGQIREHLSDAADWIEDRDYMIELEQKAHAATKAELARMRDALEEYADRENWSVYPAEGEKDCVWWQLDGEGWEVAEKALDGEGWEVAEKALAGVPVDATQKRYWYPQVGDMVSISACTIVDRYGEDIKSYHQQIVEFVTVDDHKFAKLSDGNVVYLHWLNLSREEGTDRC